MALLRSGTGEIRCRDGIAGGGEGLQRNGCRQMNENSVGNEPLPGIQHGDQFAIRSGPVQGAAEDAVDGSGAVEPAGQL